MNRRSVLRLLGLAPVAAPAAVAAASVSALPPINYSALAVATDQRIADAMVADIRGTLARITVANTRLAEAERKIATSFATQSEQGGTFTFDGETLRVPSLIVPRAAG